jgi:hypothetical protein
MDKVLEAEMGRVLKVEALADGSALVLAGTTLFHFDAPSGQLARARGAETGDILAIGQLADGDRWILAQRGWFRFDQATGRVVADRRVLTGTVNDAVVLDGGDVLMSAQRGWFHFNASSERVMAVIAAETGDLLWLRSLAGAGALIQAQRGWFHFDPSSRQVVEVAGAKTGPVLESQALEDGGALLQTEGGWFRFNAASRQVLVAGAAETGIVRRFLALAGGGRLIKAEAGWFHFNAASGQVSAVDAAEAGTVMEFRQLVNGGALFRAQYGLLFHFNPASGRILEVAGANAGRVSSIHALTSGDALIRAERGLFRFDPASGQLVAVRGAVTGRVRAISGLEGGGALVVAEHGLFRFDAASGQLVAAGIAQMGRVRVARVLTGTTVLLGAERGLFRFDAASGQMVAMGNGETGEVYSIREFSGGALIHAARGLFLFDAASGEVIAAGGVETDQIIRDIYRLAGGDALIRAESGWFRFDGRSGDVTAAGGASRDDYVSDVYGLAGGGALILAESGLARLIASQRLSRDALRPLPSSPLSRPQPSRERISPVLAFHHPCAPIVDSLGLTLVAQPVTGLEQIATVRLAGSPSPAPGIALIEGDRPFIFDQPGTWTLTLRRGATALADPLSFTVAVPTLATRITAAWEWIAGAIAALYGLAFASLLAATRRTAAAFRILNDAVWAKWLTWPFFFLRHVPAVQRWVLEPWFQEVRRTTRRDVPYLDPPVTEVPAGTTVEASSLLPKLRETPRLWLQGRSGMGKSSVFAEWERSYFSAEEGATLSRAARRFGFILVMPPVRHYATLPTPEPNRPESWVIEAVRRRFEMFGFGELDHTTVRAMLKAGHIALALDGMNEADRDNALVAFARQFPQVRLLVTSQARQEGWQLWQLPADVTQLRQGLLSRWLGAEKGAALDRRIVAEGLSETILSGYDLRLVADLAGTDPERAVLPADRIALYRAMLARAAEVAGEPMRMEGLKALAWAMVNDRRREIAEADAARLGEVALRALTREGVRILRQVGKLHEFRHDQMRAFLAALWLAEELPTVAAMKEAILKANAFSLPRRDQEEVWRFLAALIASADDLKALWTFANEKAEERGLLLDALHDEADRRDITLVRAARRRKCLQAEAGGGAARGRD